MPSKKMDPTGLSSSSFFSNEVGVPNERQIGFWRSETMHDQFGIKMDAVLGTAGRNSVASSPFSEKPISFDSQMVKSCELPDHYLIQDQKVSSFRNNVVGAQRAASHGSLQKSVGHDLGMRSNLSTEPESCFMTRDQHVMGTQYENGLFSSSLSELFSRKLRLTSNQVLYGHSVGASAAQYEEEEPCESLEEIEAQTIGNLLPDDDDLLSGVTDGLDYVGQPNAGEDIEELDLFSNVGGMDLGEDSFPRGQRDSEFSGANPQLGESVGSFAAEHPSRTLFVRNINSNVEDSELQALFEQYGDIRTLYTACKHRGFVMISYYDIRAARSAMRELQNKPLRRRKLDIHFSIPKDNPSEKDINQGTLVIFNLDSSVSNEELHQIFGIYGEIKEISENPRRNHHKFIEFYDIRAAEAARCALNRSDIAGKRIKLEPSCPGGARQWLLPLFPPETEQGESGAYLQQSISPSNSLTGFSGPLLHGGITSSGMDNGIVPGVHSTTRALVSSALDNMSRHGISSSVPNGFSSLVRVESLGNQSNLPDSGQSQGQLKVDFHGIPTYPHSLPEYHDGLTNGVNSNSSGMTANIKARPSERIDNWQFCRVSPNGRHPFELNDAVFGSPGNGSCPPAGHHYMWNSSPRPQPRGLIWPNSPTFVNGVHPSPRLHALPRAPSHMLNNLLPINNHHVGSAPSVNPSLWDRRPTYAGESPDASGFHPGSLGNVRVSGNSPHHLEFISPNIFPHVSGNCMELSIPSNSVGLHSPHQRCLMFPGRGQMIPMMSSFDSPNERARSRRNEGGSNQVDNKKQFELDIERIMRGEDNRTTLMIKNIPNKFVVPKYIYYLLDFFELLSYLDKLIYLRYTSKMLLAAIDERHRGTYDFLYLPIDFKNKCNVGYAFINMTDPSLIIPFYQAFNGKKWEKFNSEKVASLAYARIQGKAALIAHFQNSSLMNEDKRCRPILFNTDGPNAGDQVPFPMGVNVRSRPSKTRAIASEDNHQESSANGEESDPSDLSLRPTKEIQTEQAVFLFDGTNLI